MRSSEGEDGKRILSRCSCARCGHESPRCSETETVYILVIPQGHYQEVTMTRWGLGTVRNPTEVEGSEMIAQHHPKAPRWEP